MANYPTALDAIANPGPGTKQNDPGFELDVVIGRLNDIVEALEAKLGTGASTPASGQLLAGNGAGSSTYSANPTITGSFTAQTGLNVGAASGAAAGEVKASSHLKAGGKVYPGGPVTTNGSVSNQVPFVNSTLGANTSQTVTTFPIGVFWLMNLTNPAISQFTSNSVASLVDRGSDAPIQIGGADPGASSSKLWVTLSGGTLTIFNRWAAPQSLVMIGFGAN